MKNESPLIIQPTHDPLWHHDVSPAGVCKQASKAKQSTVEARHDMRAPSNKPGDETQSRVGADMQRWQWKQSKQWKQWK